MSVLTLTKEEMVPKVAGAKRMQSVLEAISWPKGPDVDHKLPTVVFSKGRYAVRLSKPGKEAAPDYGDTEGGRRRINTNDMRPEITVDGILVEKNASFLDVFDELQKLQRANSDGLELMACLLARSAFMADHKEIKPGIWRYDPPAEILHRLNEMIPLIYDVPIEVFLHYLNALALNEDVKYHTLGYDITKETGRRNNLLTCVNLIGVLLEKVRIADFAGTFSRPPAGISAISQKKLKEIFPELN